MEIVQLSRRWLLRLIPATAIALSSIGTTQADVFQPEKDAKTNYRVMLVSLIPHAPESKKSVFLDMKAGERVPVRQYLGLPLVLEMGACPRDVLDRVAQTARTMPALRDAGCSTIHLLDERGKEIKEMNIGNATTATFVDQRLSVFLSKAT